MGEDEIQIVMKNVKSDGTPISVTPVPAPEVITETFNLIDSDNAKPSDK